jgi:hypothetical protein
VAGCRKDQGRRVKDSWALSRRADDLEVGDGDKFIQNLDRGCTGSAEVKVKRQELDSGWHETRRIGSGSRIPACGM